MSKASILIIEDEQDIRDIMVYNLEREGYSVRAFESAEKGLESIVRFPPDLVLLDMMLPGIDGFEMLKRIRAGQYSRLPVIMVTARTEDADVVTGLELGADDYVCKPFSPRVLVARVRTRLRETGQDSTEDAPGVLEARGIVLDSERYECFVNGTPLVLSATEFSLLEFFLRNPGRVFSRQRLIDALHGPNYPVTDRSIDVQIVSLRKKLLEAGELIETVRGVGYRWRDSGGTGI